MKDVIQTHDLYFQYLRGPVIARGIDLSVPQGSVFGLLGENGAGKSSLLRLLTGLLRPQRGSISILGHTLPIAQRSVFQQLGLMLEHPRLYPNLTAREYLQVMATYRDLPNSRCRLVLEKTALLPYADQRIKTFSTGMQQRLSLAQALLPGGALLILDEPTNGMDPGGIALVRQLLQRERERGTTVVLSSHLLAELEQVCTHLGILHQGDLLFQGTLPELQALQTEALRLRVICSEPQLAAQLLREQFWHTALTANDHLLVDVQHKKAANQIADLLRAAEIELYEMYLVRPQLEDLFLKLTAS